MAVGGATNTADIVQELDRRRHTGVCVYVCVYMDVGYMCVLFGHMSKHTANLGTIYSEYNRRAARGGTNERAKIMHHMTSFVSLQLWSIISFLPIQCA